MVHEFSRSIVKKDILERKYKKKKEKKTFFYSILTLVMYKFVLYISLVRDDYKKLSSVFILSPSFNKIILTILNW